MGDVRDILRGGLMSQSHPAPSNGAPMPHSPTADSWRWTEYTSEYRPFSQYTYSAGSWHRNTPLDTTDGPSSWYAEVAERIHKAEEYKTRSRSSGIGETDYPSERNRLIWSNSVSALTLHDTVDSGARHRRQKSRFHSLGPAFPLNKDSKPALATASTGRSASKPRTSRSVSRRRPESKDVPDSKTGATSPTKTAAKTPTAKPPAKKVPDNKEVQSPKPRAVVKPTPAKEGDKIKEEKKWIKPAPSETIDSKAKDSGKDSKPAAEKISPKNAETPSAPARHATSASSPAAAPPAKAPTLPVVSPVAKNGAAPKPAEILKPTPTPTQPVQAAPAASEPVQPQTKPTVPEPVAKPVAVERKVPDVKPLAMATPLIPSVAPTPVAPKTAPVDPMAQSFIDHSTIGGGGPAAKVVPKPADLNMARSRLDEFWAEGK
ncbi:nucleolar protein dao-5-like [Galendromus occidentalis]|uniref:Nuclear protein MDM1 n=1 Tax=Galendromus occidentalis TaxID=34638 RepID=A0AAJ7PAI3_9ACAR|nr:nucleolar protein dao-5-like [Galendromus occidentalis]